jgi:hypothetical protein
MSRFSPILISIGFALWASPLVGCGSGENAERVEGRHMLDVLHSVRTSSRESEAYRTAVARLENVEITHERVRRVRDTCVSGHQALLGAEAEALRARQLFERVGSEASVTQEAIERGSMMALEAEREIARCAAQSISLGMRIGYQAPGAQ